MYLSKCHFEFKKKCKAKDSGKLDQILAFIGSPYTQCYDFMK
jgi:hypothetical protein